MTADEAIASVQQEAQKSAVAIRAIHAVLGDGEFSYRSNGDTVHLHPQTPGMWAYRKVRQASGKKPVSRSIHLWSESSMSGWISLDFLVSAVPVTLFLDVPDYTRCIRPGAECRIVPRAFNVECS